MMIDKYGFRANVGIILTNDVTQVFWAKRINQDAWQFPQGGVEKKEQAKDTLFRELYEEIGLEARDVKIIGSTRHWLRYKLPKKYIRKNANPLCIGQKQKWFLLKLKAGEEAINLQRGQHKIEFDDWRWVSYWYPIKQVISFKREVYRQALTELSGLIFNANRLDKLYEK